MKHPSQNLFDTQKFGLWVPAYNGMTIKNQLQTCHAKGVTYHVFSVSNQ